VVVQIAGGSEREGGDCLDGVGEGGDCPSGARETTDGGEGTTMEGHCAENGRAQHREWMHGRGGNESATEIPGGSGGEDVGADDGDDESATDISGGERREAEHHRVDAYNTQLSSSRDMRSHPSANSSEDPD
jgi:hypothetical protein